MSHHRFAKWIAISSLSFVGLASACSGGETSTTSNNDSGSNNGSGNAGGATGTGGNDDITTLSGNLTGGSGGGLTEENACAGESAEATLVKKPVDIIFIIDNSGSMKEEIEGVQDNINKNFAQIIENADIDYRVIMLTDHGAASGPESVCIEAPLSGIEAGGCAPPPEEPINNSPRFFHYHPRKLNSTSPYHDQVGSRDSWCRMFDWWDKADNSNQAADGWQEWLRKDAFKIFVEVTDDRSNCNFNGVSYNDGNNANDAVVAADRFDSTLLTLSPEHFGTEEKRNYAWYSLVGVADKDTTDPSKPWLPTDPIATTNCSDAENPGMGHQALSIKTGGLRFSLCRPDYYDSLFNIIAEGVIEGSKLACEFPFPAPPEGGELDPSSLQIKFSPSNGDPAVLFDKVADPSQCAPEKFYVEDEIIRFCPSTCTTVEDDEEGGVEILFACLSQVD